MGNIRVVEPDLDRHQQTLRSAYLEFMKADVRLDREGIEQNAGGLHFQVIGNEPGKTGFRRHALPRN